MGMSRRNLDLWEDKNLLNCRYTYLSDKYHITPVRCRQIYLKVQYKYEKYLKRESYTKLVFTLLEREYFDRAIACRHEGGRQMTRLIDVDGLKNKFWHDDLVPNKDLYHISEIMCAIDNTPTVEERAKGEWISREAKCNTSFPFWERYECPFCHKYSGYSNFCQHCGADLR